MSIFDPYEYLNEGHSPKKPQRKLEPFIPTPLGHYDYVALNEQEKLTAAQLKKMAPFLFDPVGSAYSDTFSNKSWYRLAADSGVLPSRDLNFRDKRWLTAAKANQLMREAIGGYNEFDPVDLGREFSKFSHLRFQLARERSPAIYVKGFKSLDDLLQFATRMQVLAVDELSLMNKSGRPIASGAAYSPGRNIEMIKAGIDGHSENGVKPDKAPLPDGFAEMRLWWD